MFENGGLLPSHSEANPHATGRRSDPAFELRTWMQAVRQRWWLVVGTMLVCAGAAWVYQNSRPVTYTSEVLLQKGRQAESLTAGTSDEVLDFGAQMEVLRSRTILAPVVSSLGLQLQLVESERPRSEVLRDVQVDPAAPTGTYTLAVDGSAVVVTDAEGQEVARAGSGEMLQGPGFQLTVVDPALLAEPQDFRISNHIRVVDRLRRRLIIEPGQGSGFVRIRYTDQDPELVAAVVNSVGESYVAHRARTAREAAGRRRTFIAAQLEALADSVRLAQAAVADYQANTQVLDPTATGGVVTSDLMRAESELRELRYQEDLLRNVVAAVESGTGGDENLHRVLGLSNDLLPGGAQLYARLRELQDQRSQLTASRFGFTDANPQVEILDSLIAASRADIRRSATASLSTVRNRRQAAEQQVAELEGTLGAIPTRTTELSRLQQRVEAVQGVFNMLSGEYYAAQIEEEVETGDIELVDAATVPLDPDAGGGPLGLGVALFIGLFLGLGAVGTSYYISTAVRHPDEAQRIANLKLMAVIPRLPEGRKDPEAALLGVEAFRALRTSLHFALPRGVQAIAVTSTAAEEGKSVVTSNLALALEQQGHRVLLIDADLRRPVLHTVFGVEAGQGLTDVLRGDTSLDSAVTALRPGLDLLAAGTSVRNAPELLGSDALASALGSSRLKYDVIVIDTPPVLAVSDAALISTAADGVLFVVRANRTDREGLERAIGQLRQLHVPLVGLVMNDLPIGQYGGYGTYGYRAEEMAGTPS